MDDDQTPGSDPRVGFRRYADGTPRWRESNTHWSAQPIPTDELTSEPWDSPYGEDEPDQYDVAETPTRGPRRYGLLTAGLVGCGAAVVGLVLVLAVSGHRPERLTDPSREPHPSTVAIQVAQADPTEGPSRAGMPFKGQSLRAEVLVAPVTRAASRQAAPEPAGGASAGQTPLVPDEAPAAPVETPRSSAPSDRPVAQAAPFQGGGERNPQPRYARDVQPPAPEPPAARRGLPGPLNCEHPMSPGQRLVCQDPRLVQADRRMVVAYERASAAGAPRSVLWREQVSWLNAREDAARRSNSAVAMLYRERIRDLDSESFVGLR